MSEFKWTTKHHNFLIDLTQKHRSRRGISWGKVAEDMTKQFDRVFSAEQCRSRWRTNKEKENEVDPIEEYGVEIERKENGVITIDRIIEVYSENDLKDERFVLKANGYDPDSWNIIRHKFSLWNHMNRNMKNPASLYANRLELEPKEDNITYEDIVRQVTEATDPINTDNIKCEVKESRLLEIPLMDMHFGVNTFEDYLPTLQRIYKHLDERIWEKVVITFGSDLLHVDNLKNTTANQTRIQDVDVLQMIKDAKSFYEHLVTKAIEQSKEVEVIYIKGNHDETTSGVLVHWLDARFPQVEVDTEIEEVKVRHWEEVFIAFTHGDKGGRRAKNVLATKYPMEWANSKIREFHKGHRHHEEAKDEFGITERTLSTGAKTDQFHKDNSYEGAHQRFQLFEYSEDWLESIHYV